LSIPVIQLLVVRWYPGSGITPSEAKAELARRGWNRPKQLAALALLLPLIGPDRIMRLADVARDDWEEAGTPREIAFSATLSLFGVSVLAALASAWLIIGRHDPGQPYEWRWLIGWAIIAAVAGCAARVVGRFRA
jgi:hypothetical protein